MKLIPKDTLVAEIEKYKNNSEAYLKYHYNRNDKLVHSFEQEKLVMCELLSFIDTLEVKEVGLKEEPVSDDLKLAIHNALFALDERKGYTFKLEDMFMAGAKWQKQQDQSIMDAQKELKSTTTKLNT